MREKGLEFKVGVFVFLGLAALGALVVEFGRVGEGFKNFYNLTINFPDASGLLKGSDVLMSGAKVGFVSGGPRLNPGGEGVLVPLRVYGFVKVPLGSKFVVGSSGLLGDRYVSIWRPPPNEVKDYFHADATVAGTRETGMDDLTREGGALVQDLRNAVQNINGMFTRLNEQGLSQTNLDNLKSTVAGLNQTSANLAESSKKLDGVIDKAGSTMDSARQAADGVQVAIVDARKTIQSAGDVFREARTGNGLLATLLNNQQVAHDLSALISNLRAHGVLFYRDSAAKTQPPPQPTPRSRGR